VRRSVRAVAVALNATLVALAASTQAHHSPSRLDGVAPAAVELATYVQAGPGTPPQTATRARSTPGGCVAKGRFEMCFSAPASHNGKDPSVVERIRNLFRSAGAGDTLLVAMFRWDIASPAKALIEAQQRGARVELVADRDVVTNPVGKNLTAQLEQQDPTRKNVIICKGACLPWRAKGPAPPAQDVNHLKLVVAEIAGERSVMTTSLNLEGRQYSQVNSSLRMIDDDVFAFSVKYFKRLRRQNNGRWDDSDKIHVGGRERPTAVVYPRRKDLLISTLRGVRCAKGANTVDVVHAVIQRHDVRAELGRLQRSGCRVRVVVTRQLIENWLQARQPLPGGGTADIPDARVRTILNHDKVWAIHAMWKGKKRFLVVTGTSNATCGGLLYNDEMMVRLQGKWVWQQYTRHFERTYAHAQQSPNPKALPVQRRCG
jgi:phospholipase D-like protein